MANSNNYFSAVAEQWDEMRAGYFTEHMRDAAIARAGLPAAACVADVGTGTGFVAQGLADTAAQVFGFDANAGMLAAARRNLADRANVAFGLSEGDRLPLANEALDGVFANMFLHHAPDPAAAIREMARVLRRPDPQAGRPGGVLCLTDLDSHNHEWQREQMADLWLGFQRLDIQRWLEQAGLTEVEVDCAEGECCAAGPNGTVEPLSVFIAIGRRV
jgi:ubiquinone/menaquinone biosynthesis C-methylase UbiE